MTVRKDQVSRLVRAAREHDRAAADCWANGGSGKTTPAFRRAESAWIRALGNATDDEAAEFRRVYE
jgi:hypothetical protein